MNPFPSISVILTAYNAEAFMRRAIDELLAQTFFDFEILIIEKSLADNLLIEKIFQLRYRFQVYDFINMNV